MKLTIEDKKLDPRAAVISISLHAILLALLLFLGLKPPDPPPPPLGVFMLLEAQEPTTPTPKTPNQPARLNKPAAATTATTSPAPQSTTPLTQETEPAPSVPPKPQINPEALYKGPKNNTDIPQNDHPDFKPFELPGNEDLPGAEPGTTESRTGLFYSLAGRKLIKSPEFNVNTGKEGKVRLKITVDRNGNVVRAEYDPAGSTTADPDLIEIARRLAKKLKFNPDQNAPTLQKGTVTFEFRIK